MPLARLAFSHWRGSEPEPHLQTIAVSPTTKRRILIRLKLHSRVPKDHWVRRREALHPEFLYFQIRVLEEDQDGIEGLDRHWFSGKRPEGSRRLP